MGRWWLLIVLGVVVAAVAAIGVGVAVSGDPASRPSAGAQSPAFTATVDNPYFPLPPGRTWTYQARVEDGTERTVVQVTSDTRMVNGVPCVVVHDTVRVNGEVIEDTFDWYSQDRDGNVWYFGEDTKEYENGRVTSTEGSWEAGADGAKAGILMKARPQVGDRYRQEYYAGHAEDMGEVLSLTERADVPAGSYGDVLMTKDFTPLEPDLLEHKYYARGVGVVLEVTVRGGSDRVELVEMTG